MEQERVLVSLVAITHFVPQFPFSLEKRLHLGDEDLVPSRLC